MGFQEDAIAAALAVRQAEAAARKAEAEALQARINQDSYESISATWFTNIGVNPNSVDLTVTEHKEAWIQVACSEHPTYNDNPRHYPVQHPAETKLEWVLEGHEFRAEVTHSLGPTIQWHEKLEGHEFRAEVTHALAPAPLPWESHDTVIRDLGGITRWREMKAEIQVFMRVGDDANGRAEYVPVDTKVQLGEAIIKVRTRSE